MICFFNSVTVYLGFDVQQYYEMKRFLKSQGIPYKTKVHNMNRATRMGSMGMRMKYSIQYEILIHKKDEKRLKQFR